MKPICAWCGSGLGDGDPHPDRPITLGICKDCASAMLAGVPVDVDEFLDRFDSPIVLLNQAGNIAGVNRLAQLRLGKTREEIDHLLVGNVFECRHARLPGGCGKTVHCMGCAIRRTFTECLREGGGRRDCNAVLHRHDHGRDETIRLRLSAERLGNYVLMRIDAMRWDSAPPLPLAN